MITLDIINAMCYYRDMIRSFRDQEAAAVFQRNFSRRLPDNIQRTALRKLLILDAATGLNDLRVPPGNRLEALSGSRKGRHSIRINQQWRICFRWEDGQAHDVEIVDYH